jgi:hypothetical protein
MQDKPSESEQNDPNEDTLLVEATEIRERVAHDESEPTTRAESRYGPVPPRKPAVEHYWDKHELVYRFIWLIVGFLLGIGFEKLRVFLG